MDYWTSKDVLETLRSHVNYVVADTKVSEQSAAYILDTHPSVQAFVKNVGFAIPYLHNGQTHDYVPDFLVTIDSKDPYHLIVETKGYDPLAEIKAAAAQRWVSAVNTDGQFGRWEFRMARSVGAVRQALDEVSAESRER